MIISSRRIIKVKLNLIVLFLNFNVYLFAQGYVCAIGGGSENYNDWSDAPYRWIVQKADSGKIIIIDVADATNWLPNYFMSLGADTAYNKTIPNTSSANLQSTYDELITAKAIFIRGGNQWDYIRLWKGTKVDSAIQYVFNNGGVIAGTSAGAAVLGDVDFSAQNGSAYPDDALLNPFYSRMKFEHNFLKLVPDVLFDTHFIERGRHGRLIAMIYNLFFSSGLNLIGVGIDDRTAICISPDGVGEVMGSGAVTIFYKDDLTNYSTYNSGKYTIENLKSHILTKGWKFNFNNREITYIPSSAKDIDTSRGFQFPLTNFYLNGNNDLNSHLNTSLPEFLNNVNSSSVLVISNQGYTASSNVLTYLNSHNYNSNILQINTSNLNSQEEASKIANASCIIIMGDSLNVLSYLNQIGNLVPDAFYSAMQSGKPIFFFGNAGKISGEKYIDNTDSDLYASYRGKMTFNNGVNLFGELIFQPLLFDNSDFYENRTSAVLWGLMRSRKRIGLYLNNTNYVKISSSEKSLKGVASIPYLIVDASEATKVDSSTYRASGSIGPRQVVAFDNLRWSLTNYSQIKYLFEQKRFDSLTDVDENLSEEIPAEFVLYQNYPNPFNTSTKIRYSISSNESNNSRNQKVTLKIYDALGREIKTLVSEYKSPGIYDYEFDASALSSGIYFYRLTVGNSSQTKSMVLMK